MTLDDWIELSPDDRNVRRRRWERDRGEWMALLSQARARFEAEFRTHPLINHIGESVWQSSREEPSILVATALYSPQRIEELPDRFCTFRVVQDQVLDRRDFYLRYWTLLFGELLGWPEARTHEWATRWDDELNERRSSLFYHEDPYYYAIPVVIRESLPTAQSHAHLSMAMDADVRRAIRSHGSDPIWLSPYDWEAARERVNVVLRSAGGRLPR
jgi:hypothetical protein